MFAILLVIGPVWAQTTEYLTQKDFKVEKQKIYDALNSSRKQLSEAKKTELTMVQSVDSLKRVIGYCTGQIGISNDSLSKTCAKLNALQENVDKQKQLSRNAHMVTIVILVVLLALLFFQIFLFKKKLETQRVSLSELDKQTNDRFDLETKTLRSEIRSCSELIVNISNEMDQRVTAGLTACDNKGRQIEQQLQASLAGIEGKIEIIGPEISKIKEELSGQINAISEKVTTFKQEADQCIQGLASQTAKLEETVRLLKGSH